MAFVLDISGSRTAEDLVQATLPNLFLVVLEVFYEAKRGMSLVCEIRLDGFVVSVCYTVIAAPTTISLRKCLVEVLENLNSTTFGSVFTVLVNFHHRSLLSLLAFRGAVFTALNLADMGEDILIREVYFIIRILQYIS